MLRDRSVIRTGATQAAPILRMGVPQAQLAPILRMRAPVLPAPRASLPDVRAHPEFAPVRELGSCGSRTRANRDRSTAGHAAY